VRIRYRVVAQYISPTHAGELVTPGKQVKAAANWSSRLPWAPVRHGQWRVAVVASQVEHVSITVVCGARVVGKPKPHLPQPGAMADASNVRHDTIVVPETMSPAQVRALAERKAQAQVGDVAFLHLHGSRPVDGGHGTEVEWRYSYQVIPPGGPAADTAG
jgi:hypothetical protein